MLKLKPIINSYFKRFYFGEDYYCIKCNSHLRKFLNDLCPICSCDSETRAKLLVVETTLQDITKDSSSLYIGDKDDLKDPKGLVMDEDSFIQLSNNLVDREFNFIIAHYLPEKMFNRDLFHTFISKLLGDRGVYIGFYRSHFKEGDNLDLSSTQAYSSRINHQIFNNQHNVRRYDDRYGEYLKQFSLNFSDSSYFTLLPNSTFKTLGVDSTIKLISLSKGRFEGLDHKFEPLFSKIEEEYKTQRRKHRQYSYLYYLGYIIYFINKQIREMILSTSDINYNTNSWRYIFYSSILSGFLTLFGVVSALAFPLIGGLFGAPFMLVGMMTIFYNFFMLSFSSPFKRLGVLIIFLISIISFFGLGYFMLFLFYLFAGQQLGGMGTG